MKPEDFGITTSLKPYCKHCHIDGLELDTTTLWADDEMYIRHKNVTCRFAGVCEELYGRIKAKNKAVIARALVDYMTLYGISHTISGNYHFDFEEINEIFATNLPEDKELMELILDTVDRNIVSDLDVTEDFDFMFYLGFCPYAQED